MTTVSKLLVLLLVLSSFLKAIDPRIQKSVSLLLEKETYKQHERLINTIFSDTQAFIENNTTNSFAVLKKLKDNGLLQLYFKTPQTIKVNFKTGGNAQFFVKLLRDTLQSIGYYRYFTTLAQRDNNTFLWQIELKSEYAIDPTVLQQALNKRFCFITHMQRITPTRWNYTIDIGHAKLSLLEIDTLEQVMLRKSLRPYWINISKGKKLTIYSQRGDSWFPDIALFDKSMHLLKVYKRKERTRELSLYLPKDAIYIKISDLYMQRNIKHGLKLLLEGEK